MTSEALTDYLTFQDAAIRSGFSESALRNRVRAGQIPIIKPGPRCILLHKQSVDALALCGGQQVQPKNT